MSFNSACNPFVRNGLNVPVVEPVVVVEVAVVLLVVSGTALLLFAEKVDDVVVVVVVVVVCGCCTGEGDCDGARFPGSGMPCCGQVRQKQPNVSLSKPCSRKRATEGNFSGI
jgi:hypothetical protein